MGSCTLIICLPNLYFGIPVLFSALIVRIELSQYTDKYSQTSMARTPMGPWKYVRDRDSSSQWGLTIAQGQEA